MLNDGETVGELMIRGFWVSDRYFKGEATALSADGWFHTGDVSTLDEDGYLKITDRSKDVIRSGGEWISTIDIEDATIGHPDVAEAAVVGVPHPKRDERPVLLVVPKEGRNPTDISIREFLADKIKDWWQPDCVFFIDRIPHTATGKIKKSALRLAYCDALLDFEFTA